MSRRDLLLALAVTAVAGTGLSACRADAPPRAGSGRLRLISSEADRTPADASTISATVEALQRFGGRLFGRMAEAQGNVALSPWSVAVALGMAANGAVGATADEIQAVLGDLGVREVSAGLNALEQALEGLGGPVRREDGTEAEIVLALTSALFGERTEVWKEPFLDRLAGDYGAGMRTVDFKGAPEEARTLVNGWVADRTEDRIPELIPPDLLDTLTRLVLVNTLYLKAPWESPFEGDLTEPSDFHLADGSTVTVDMMQSTDLGDRVTRGDGWRAVRVPYAGRELAMTVVLPDGDLAPVERVLAGAGTGAFLAVDEAGGPLANLRMPRWAFRSAAALAEVLSALGMPSAFDADRADFSAMTDDERLFLSAVQHEVFLAVDEEGTEAAAATAEIVVAGSAPLEIEDFLLDRPFLFVIHDVDHGTPLLVGRVADPRG